MIKIPDARTTLFLTLSLLSGCATTEIVESPRTAYVSESAEVHEPQIIWTSRIFTKGYDYLGLLKVRSWTYQGAIDRLLDAAKEVKADAIIDVHFERIGFLNAMEAFAIKYK
jgi:uncharacterized protein YbjQ (UPF0145 family)